MIDYIPVETRVSFLLVYGRWCDENDFDSDSVGMATETHWLTEVAVDVEDGLSLNTDRSGVETGGDGSTVTTRDDDDDDGVTDAGTTKWNKNMNVERNHPTMAHPKP